MGPIISLALMLILFWVIIVLPQRRRLQAQRALVAGLKVGDDVMMTAGVHGTIVALDADDAHVRIADGVVVRAARWSIGTVVGAPTRKAGSGRTPTSTKAAGAAPKAPTAIATTTSEAPSDTAEELKADELKSDEPKADSGKADSGKADSGKADSGKADSGKADSGTAEPDVAKSEPASDDVNADAAADSDG